MPDAVDGPAVGGQTLWCNCYRAFEESDDELKRRLKVLSTVHRRPIRRKNSPETFDHPVVCTHPEMEWKSLFVSPHLISSIVGPGESESRDLLAQLIEHMAQLRFVWIHDWKPDDLVMWDNRPTRQ